MPVELPGLVHIDVTISGHWDLPYPNARWKGAARAAEPIVAVALVECAGRTEWAKSPRAADSLDLSLVLHLSRWNAADFQFIFFLGGAWTQETVSSMPTDTYQPDLPAERTVKTGRLIDLASAAGDPPVSVQALFLARRDVRFHRKHIWRLRPPLLAGIAPPFHAILAKGRTGLLPAP